ncbi:polysaccharide pyruvyl transferase family protein [Psychrobacter frigidicola]|uniref:Polysaccharide pyruvyl transferase family protein n=1 Tax=Psychrobacter frigidicola TaxID=45611 RepID=A0A5C7A3A2_9GAMM|nr:polysaccharide pyruvyl transferase family protein [Psychrobacter frigidicola]TXD98097.1 polysaccharide pyruvyl transferase family protein [Psychrobacter frigidicola]
MYKNIFKSEILFTGYYGQLNTGDDAFLEVASWGAKKYWNKSNSIYLSRKKGLPILCRDIRGYPLSIPKTYHLQDKILLPLTDYLISAGGSTMNKELQASNIKRLAMEHKKKHSKIKIGGIGVSIGPFRTTKDEESTIDYLKNIDFLAVRDQASFDFAMSLDLPYEPVNAFDLAALLPEIYGIQKKDILLNNTKVVGISVCPFESIVDKNNIENEHKRNAKVINLLKVLDKKEDIHFKFFIINGHPTVGDLRLTQETIERVAPNSYEIINYNKETRATWNEISSCDFVISTRLHAAIFACFSNTPFMLNEYHRKCGDFLDDIHYDKSLRLFDSEYNPVEKANSIIDILNDQSNYIYPTKLDEMKNKSELNFTGVII